MFKFAFRIQRAPVLCAFAVAAGLALCVPAVELAAAPIGYVYYLQTFGDWTVTCGRDESSGRDNCTLSAPPPERHGDSQIEIGNGQGDNGAVILRVRGALMPGSPLYLRVDAKPPHQAQPNRFGEGRWYAEEAETIIAELNSGQRAVVRSFSGPPPAPRDAFFSLDRFGEALADFDGRTSGKPSRETSQAPAPEPEPEPEPERPARAPEVAPPVTPAPVTPPAAAPPPQPPQPPTPPTPVQEERPASPVTEEPRPPERQVAPVQAATGAAVTILDEAHVGRAKLTTNVVNREPVDELGSTVPIPASGDDFVYFFTEIRGMAGRTVTHRWQYGGNVVASVTFPIGSDRWRVYSRKAIAANQTGSWTITAVAPNGTELARAAFTAE